MIIRIKDFSGITQVRDNPSLFGDGNGDDFLSYGRVQEKLDPAKKQFSFVATTADVDHHDEVVAQGAFHEERGVYLRNPVLLANHMHRTDSGKSTVAGYTLRLATDKNPVTGLAQMVDTEVGRDHSVAIFSGAQRGVSVGFRVRETEREDGRVVITKALLLEISVVSVPANPFALVLNYVQGKLADHTRTLVDSSEKHDWAQMIKELRDDVEAMKERFDSPRSDGRNGDNETGLDEDDFVATASKSEAQNALAGLARDLHRV